MTPILFAGGDIRVDPGLPDAAWDRKRRQQYLVRPEVTRPLSVDRWVWPKPRPVAGEPVGDPLPWVSAEDVHQRWASSHVGTDGWVVIAIGVVAVDSHAREVLARSGIDAEVVVGPGWRFLGYDIADAGDTSGLSNCGYEGHELEPPADLGCAPERPRPLLREGRAKGGRGARTPAGGWFTREGFRDMQPYCNGGPKWLSLRAVAAQLAAEGHVSRKGSPFSAVQVARMLSGVEAEGGTAPIWPRRFSEVGGRSARAL